MATARRNNTVRVLGVVRRNRRSLMMGTALQTTVMLVLALPADAQPAPNARPAGGSVVAGSAAISQTTNNTRINQTTQRAAIDWRSFDIGSQQSVTFNQPSASAVALNRVTGPDPSQIAGRIDANGQIILVNQSGVNFYKGAQVNAAGVMVSAANISNANFMAGVMKFDQPGNPNAKIDNQGAITVQQTGLAALVAPQVANSGTISAKLGHVVLAGAKTATLDLYGDGLLSLDVTNQVTQAPVGPDGKAATALVTNTGVIAADGGTVQLTARAADGIVQNLVQAGGNIRAATMGDHTGVVALNGVGGSIVVEGQLSAPGRAPGTKGGAIEVATSGNVTVASTAKINASGKAGGGVVGIGTTLNRAKGGPTITPTLTAANTVIQPGAKIGANATSKGDGGRVTVLATESTDMAGTISARGGKLGGDGGFVEVSGEVLGLTGTVDTFSPVGAPGTILLDPQDLIISATQPTGFPTVPITPDTAGVTFTIIPPVATAPTGGGVPFTGGGGTTTNSWITPASIAALKGNISIAAARDLTVASALDTTDITNPNALLQLVAGRNMTILQPVKANNLILFAGGINFSGVPSDPTGSITINAPVTAVFGMTISGVGGINIGTGGALAAQGIAMLTFNGGIALTGNAAVRAVNLLQISSNGPVSEAPTSTITAGLLSDTVPPSAVNGTTFSGVTGNVQLLGTGNNISTLSGFTVTNGDMVVVNGDDLTLSGTVRANNLFFEVAKAGGTLTLGEQGDGAIIPVALSAAGTGGRISLVADNYNVLPLNPSQTPSSIATNAGTVELAPFSAIGISLPDAGGVVPIIHTVGGTLEVGAFTDVPAGATSPAPRASAIDIAGPRNLSTDAAATLRLDSTGPITETGGPLTVANLTANSRGGSVTLANPLNTVASVAGSAANGFTLDDSGAASLTVNTVSVSTVGLTAKAMTIPGTVTGTTSVGLTATAGGIAESGGGVILGNGALTANSTGGSVTLANPLNTVASVASSATNGFTLDDSGAASLTVNTVNAATVGLTAKAISIPGTVTGTTSVGLTATAGSVAESGSGVILGNGALTANSTGGSVTLANPLNTVASVAGSATNGFTLSNVGALTVVPNTLAAGTLNLSSSGAITVSAPIDTRGAVSLNAGTNLFIGTGATITAGGDILLKAATVGRGVLTVGAAVQSGGLVFLSDPIGPASGNGIIFNAPVTSTRLGTSGGPLITVACDCFISGGGNGILNAGTGTVEFGPSSNGFNFNIGTSEEFIFAGLYRFGQTHDPVTGALGALAGNLTLGRLAIPLDFHQMNLELDAGGSIVQFAGSSIQNVANLSGRAGTFATFDQANTIASLGPFSTTAGFTLVNNKSLLVDGPVTDTGTASTLALTTRTGDITLAGNVSATNVVGLNSAGAIIQTGGSLAAGTLTGSAVTTANVAGANNDISFFGPFTAPSGAIVLADAVPLTIDGPLIARAIGITATGSITLASDITIGGLPGFTTTIPTVLTTDLLASGGGASFTVLPDTSGNSSFTANAHVLSLSGTRTSVFVTMPAQGGNVDLTDLNAPSTDFVLNLGSGNASGQVVVGNLAVLGAGGRVNFTNSTVQGFTGSAAALAAQSSPPANPAYLLNGCEIGVGCNPPTINLGVLAQGVSVSSGISNIVASLITDASVAPIQSAQEANPRGVPILNPMRDLSGGPLRDRQSDPDLLLPNVSEKDY